MKKSTRSSAPAASATARKKGAKKAPALDKSYKRIYHAFFLKIHENAPHDVRYAMCKGDESVEFLPWKVFINTEKIDDGVGYTDPLKTVPTAIIKLCLDIHERVRAAFSARTRDPEFIAQLAKIAQPHYEFMKPCDDDDDTNFVYSNMRAGTDDSGPMSTPDAKTAAAAAIRIIKRLACAHAACVLTCHKMPKVFVTALCYAAALPESIAILSMPAAPASDETKTRAKGKAAAAAAAASADDASDAEENASDADASDADTQEEGDAL